FPLCEVILFPSLVQGEEAKYDIVDKLKIADNFGVDVIILGRGGGSIEDLWPFNEEIVARAVYEANTPIISAVGHEIDFTICDFVADLRAETPTGAAERAVPNLTDVLNYIDQLTIRVSKSINSKIENNKINLKRLTESYILKNPLSIYEIKEQKLDIEIDKINSLILNYLDTYNIKVKNIIEKLEILNPMNALKRGYSVVKKDNKVVSIKGIKENDTISIEMQNGTVISKVSEVKTDA
ncbi:MAG: exodeoxyribonuclease VII large subunit, partial [Bacilli bacterium]